MADYHSGGDTGRPRHAEPWWMDEPESMEDTHSFRRDELRGDPTELRGARFAAPRRGLSDSAIHAAEESEPTRYVDPGARQPPERPGAGEPPHPAAYDPTPSYPALSDSDLSDPTSDLGFSGLRSRPRSSDSGTRDHLASSASDAARIRRASSEDSVESPLTSAGSAFGSGIPRDTGADAGTTSGPASAAGATPGSTSGARHSADSPDDPYSLYRRTSSASHSISRSGGARHSADSPYEALDSTHSADAAQNPSSDPEPASTPSRRRRRRRPGTAAAAATVAATAAASSATPVDDPDAEMAEVVMRGAGSESAGSDSSRSDSARSDRASSEDTASDKASDLGRQRAGSFQEGRYALDAEPDDRVKEKELRSESGRAQSRAFRKASLWTVLGALVPGLGLMHSRVHRRRRFGLVLIGLVLVAITVLAIEAVTNPAGIASIAVRPRLLRLISLALPIGALVLVGLLVFTHIDIRPRKITRTQRWVSSLLVGTLSLLIAAPLTVGSRYANDEAAALSKIFKDRRSGTRPSIDTNKNVNDIWRDKKRVNVLLVGADDSGQRNYRKQGEMNTDTMMVASINTQTGDTSLIQIPRNTANIPFPKDSKLHQIYPDGFSNGHGDDANFFANALWTTVENEHKDAMGATDYPGADALKLGIGEALGLKLDYFMMLDIDGLQKFIEAIGGVTVNVNERLPIAGNTEGKTPTGYIEVGPNQHLSGYNAMWYARSRSASTDYDRMGRQSCLIKAVLDQVDPKTVVTRFEAIASASGDMVVSDIPEKMLPAFVELALRVRGGNINRLLFTQGRNGFQPYDPDYDLIRKQVKQTISAAGNKANKNKPVTKASSKISTTPSTTPTAKKTASSPPDSGPASASPSASSSAVSQSVTDVCAYHPVTQQR
uniref:LCP family protein n=1 Tax=Acidipropionibacterium acidipropionici TaxID=1748 RepID=UPI0026BB51C9